MTVAILCSGQGGQKAGMFALLADAPAAAPVFAAARSILGIDPRDLVEHATDAEIHTDRLGQILCCTQALAAGAVIADSLSGPLVVAGYSVGELAAWGIAGLLDVPAVLALAVARAAAMDAATTEPSGLAAVRGLRRPVLDQLCQAHGCFVAIVNTEDQMLVGGTLPALRALLPEALARGAQRTVLLPVAVASHTPLLATASDVFGAALSAAPIKDRVPAGRRLLSGIDGAPVFDVVAGAAKLARQIRQTVDWAACMDDIRSSRVSKVIELGPGAALARMMRAEMPRGDVHSLAEFHSLDGFMRWVVHVP